MWGEIVFCPIVHSYHQVISCEELKYNNNQWWLLVMNRIIFPSWIRSHTALKHVGLKGKAGAYFQTKGGPDSTHFTCLKFKLKKNLQNSLIWKAFCNNFRLPAKDRKKEGGHTYFNHGLSYSLLWPHNIPPQLPMEGSYPKYKCRAKASLMTNIYQN